MLKYHFEHCRKCNAKLLTATSKDFKMCFYCRNYTKMELKRLVEWNQKYQMVLEMPTKTRFQRYERDSILLELKLCRHNYIKTGYMTRNENKKLKQNKTDNVILDIAMRKPYIETQIMWVKTSKAGKGATVKETREKRK